MNNIASFFDKKKRKLSNNSNERQDTKNQDEALSFKLFFEKDSVGNAFKISKYLKGYIDIAKIYGKYWEKIDELCISTKNRKEI